MDSAIHFACGTTSETQLVPSTSLVSIHRGIIFTTDGIMSTWHLFSNKQDICVDSKLFFEAYKATQLESLYETNNKFIATGNGVKINLPKHDSCFVEPQKKFKKIKVPKNFLDIIKKLSRFMATDTAHQWATGILLRPGKMLSTNSLVFIEHAIDLKLTKDYIIPAQTVINLLRINIAPSFISEKDNCLYFLYKKGILKTSCIDAHWPDDYEIKTNINKATTIKSDFFESLKKIKNFLNKDSDVYITKNKLQTHIDFDKGAQVTVPSLNNIKTSRFSYKQLSDMQDIATHIDFSSYPKPCPFTGSSLKGLIAGKIIQ